MQTWLDWKQQHRYKIQHIAGYEEKFVDNVLSKIDLISPEDVIPQYHFIDHKGGNRYVDFVIKIHQGNKITLLPIELDGKTKFEQYASFNDTLERQNDLIKQFGCLLRYTNLKMLNQPESIINEITQYIQDTINKKDTAELQRKNYEQYKQSIESRLAEINQKISDLTTPNKELETLKNKQQQTEKELKHIHSTITKLHSTDMTSNKKWTIPLFSICFAILAGIWITNYFVQSTQTKDEITKDYIYASESAKYLGEEKTVCGQIVEIKSFAKGVFVNLNKPYPNQDLTIVIWEEDLVNIGTQFLTEINNKNYCAKGILQEYKGQIRLKITQFNQLKKWEK
ncbi:hypothetical protein [Lonepinella sp. BR2474]|uniref:hypothetical protein n=1 Tax=Lonepinella sp. BR2474 TaxID=3434548 RepID=UPI003F6E3856